MNRRDFMLLGGAGVLALTAREFGAFRGISPTRNDGRLSARPRRPEGPGGKFTVGTTPLGMGGSRDGVIVVPKSYSVATPAPMLLALHGAGGTGERFVQRIEQLATEHGIIIVAPDSRGPTWDAIRGSFDDDVVFIDQVLKRVFSDFNIDANRVIIGGFSDGATYALSLGLVNGDLFRRIAAFSPGFIAPGTRHGKPEVFVSHGKRDEILPFRASDAGIVPSLRSAGYAMTFHEFDGGHAVPPEVIAAAGPWMKK